MSTKNYPLANQTSNPFVGLTAIEGASVTGLISSLRAADLTPDNIKERLNQSLVTAGFNETPLHQEVAESIVRGILTDDLLKVLGNDFFGRYVDYRAVEKVRSDKETLQDETMKFVNYALLAVSKGEWTFEMALKEIRRKVDDCDAFFSPPDSLASITIPPNIDALLERLAKKPQKFETPFQMIRKVNGKKMRRKLWFLCGYLSIMAAFTGHMKTTMLINLLYQAAMEKPDLRHYLIVLEETDMDAYLKSLSAYCKLELGTNNLDTLEHSLRGDNSLFKDEETKKWFYGGPFKKFWELVKTGVINIRSSESATTEDLDHAFRRISKDRPGLVLVDYIQEIQVVDGDRMTGTEKLEKVGRDLKTSAKRYGLPVVMAAQLGRSVKGPWDMEVGSLFGSSQFEKSAAFVGCLWYPDGPQPQVHPKGKKPRFIEIPPRKLYLRVEKMRRESRGWQALYSVDPNTGFIDPKTDDIPDIPAETTPPKSSPKAFKDEPEGSERGSSISVPVSPTGPSTKSQDDLDKYVRDVM